MRRLKVLLIGLMIASPLLAQGNGLPGQWTLVPQASSDIDLYRALSLDINQSDGTWTIQWRWGGGRAHEESLQIGVDGAEATLPVAERVFASNAFSGLARPVGQPRRFTAKLDGKALVLTERFALRGSQGTQPVTATHIFKLLEEDILAYRVTRSTRTEAPQAYTLKRQGARQAWVYQLGGDWRLDAGLPDKALLLSLQGLLNRERPTLYLVYPDNWDYRFTPEVLGDLKSRRFYTFTEGKTVNQLVQKLGNQAQGYVVWDPKVRTSLIAAMTVAGVERALLATEAQIPLLDALGLKPVADLRGRFDGWTDAQIYGWMKDNYWDRCDRSMLVWMGGEHGAIMKPGVADWGMAHGAFFTDCSSRPSDTEEYELAKSLLADLEPMSMVYGWHSYKKDKEREHVTLVSSYGHRVEGLHTLPNLSFMAGVPATPGFVYHNRHQLDPQHPPKIKNKVYIACVQTDCLGLGAWTRPGRGAMPYAWEVTMNWSWLAPSMMEFFYTQATDNDYFIGSLSGPGYLYPKAVPEDKLPGLIAEAYRLMKQLDLNVFETMDYSEGATVEGNTELPKTVVDAYYHGMPGAIGFINGYAPARTFTCHDGRSFLSFDYYLSPEKPEAEAAADLLELATVNAKRPYFLLMHVRQWSDITRVQDILDRLGSKFEIVPLDIFLNMAGRKPTYQEHYQD